MPRQRLYDDDIDRQRHRAYLKSRCLAKFRKEEWQLTIEDYFLLWPEELWQQRGKKSGELCMARVDQTKPWSVDNVKVIKRYWHITRNKQSHRTEFGPREI